MVIYLGLLVLGATLACETAARRGWLPYWVARKVLHAVAVGSCALAAVITDHYVLIPVVGVAWLLLLFLVGSGRLMREEDGRPAWGIVWFPLAFLLLLLLAPARTAALGMLVLALCDPAATVVGRLLPWRPYRLTSDGKTVAGSMAFLATTLAILMYFLPQPVPYLLVFAGILTLCEALGYRGSDNLLVPLATGILAEQFTPGIIHPALPAAALLALPFGWFTVRYRLLSPAGAAVAILIGLGITAGPGPRWLLPLLLFFGSSSLIGRLFRREGAGTASDAKDRQPRDAAQVLANGAAYLYIGLFLYQSPGVLYLSYSYWRELLLVVAAVATADTWASEIGQYFRRPTFDPFRWRRVPPGLSGGISGAGTAGAVMGSTLIASSGYFLVPDYSLFALVMIAAVGIMGMFLDSLLGAYLQVKFIDAAGREYDTPPAGTHHRRGLPLVTNDVVNFLTTAGTALLVLAFYHR